MNGMPPYMNDDNQPPPYEMIDRTKEFNSIVKDILANMEMELNVFEARLRAKKIDESGNVIADPKGTAYIRTDQAARDFMDLIRGKVNKHIDFSFFNEAEADTRIRGNAESINRWLMLQGEDVPLRYRRKLADMAMALIDASYHKATNGRMLTTLGRIYREGNNNIDNNNNNQQGKGGFWDAINPFKRNKQVF